MSWCPDFEFRRKGTKIFAIRPARFWRSSCNRLDAILVVSAIIAQVSGRRVLSSPALSFLCRSWRLHCTTQCLSMA